MSELKQAIEGLLMEPGNLDKTSAELQQVFDGSPTGSILMQKARRRAVESRRKDEQKIFADTFVDSKIYPEAVTEYGQDGKGEFVKIYFDGKSEDDD